MRMTRETDQRSRIAVDAEQVAVEDVMSRGVLCVPAEMTLDDLAAVLIERALGTAPVVDAGGRLIGMVTTTDLARAAWDPELRGRSATVADVMMPFAFTLAGSATLARAAALMSYEGVGRIVIAAPDGRVAGVISGMDVMRWLAREHGYVVPGYTQAQHQEDLGRGGGAPSSRVLVVDDDVDLRDGLAEVLRDLGYEVTTAGDGGEALAAIRTGVRPSLILLDLAMPGMDGWTFSAELHKDPGLVGIPVVVMSGQGSAREEATRLDARACLVKPVPYPALVDTIERFCAT
jgi:CheY-like chemotaxis protein/predicted transcriptional regulator